VFAYAPADAVLLNPAFAAPEDRAYHGETDKRGKAFQDDIIKMAQEKGAGWVNYWLPRTDRAVSQVELREGSEGRGRGTGGCRVLT
jgi:hypothetical protein